MLDYAAILQAARDREAWEIAAHAAAQLPAAHPDRCKTCGVRVGDNSGDCDTCRAYCAAECDD